MLALVASLPIDDPAVGRAFLAVLVGIAGLLLRR